MKYEGIRLGLQQIDVVKALQESRKTRGTGRSSHACPLQANWHIALHQYSLQSMEFLPLKKKNGLRNPIIDFLEGGLVRSIRFIHFGISRQNSYQANVTYNKRCCICTRGKSRRVIRLGLGTYQHNGLSNHDYSPVAAHDQCTTSYKEKSIWITPKSDLYSVVE